MSEKTNSITKPMAISGFPEWLPAVRRAEQQWQDTARRVFERYGFCSIETPSVEALDVIAAKGVVDKEIYVLNRLQSDEGDKNEARLALHFDQTVPLARYVAQYFNELAFPFKRYQMQRVWRGDRPQDGRFREFYQFDVDVIAVDNLPLHFDAEMPAIIWELLKSLPGLENEKIQVQISNRKILTGYLKSIGISNNDKVTEIIRIFDKRGKVDDISIRHELRSIDSEKFQDMFDFWMIALDIVGKQGLGNPSFLEHAKQGLVGKVRNNHSYDPSLETGFDELKFVLDGLKDLPQEAKAVNLLLARGLDYYTGTIYEGKLLDYPEFGSVIAGGRYDDLASSYINKKLPGVGISLGATRLFSKLLKEGKLPQLAPSPTQVLVALPSEELRAAAQAIAQKLRARGVNAEVYHAPQKYDRQFAYAEKKQIPFVWFPDKGEVRNMDTREQIPADAKTWLP